jgi:hypothetical protein
MIETRVTEDTIRKARERAVRMGELRNSIRHGEGNLVGFIGEIVVNEYIRGELVDTYDYDLTKNETKFDVKTKETSVKPKPHYECSIADFNPNQNCDYYIFARVHKNLDKCWILGYKSKEAYFAESRLLRKGDVDGDNGFVVKADCHNLEISRLEPMEQFSETFQTFHR